MAQGTQKLVEHGEIVDEPKRHWLIHLGQFIGFFLCLYGGIFSFVLVFQYLLVTPVSPHIFFYMLESFGALVVGRMVLWIFR